jgi:hypothetical protein
MTLPIVVHRAVGSNDLQFRGRYSVLGALFIDAHPLDLIEDERDNAPDNLLTYSEWRRLSSASGD